jgi:hypothetical protein
MFLFLLTQARLVERYGTHNLPPAPKD